MLKGIQSLNGKLAALSRFLSKGAKRSLPFFKVLKSFTDKKNIQWTQEAAAALQEMKKFIKALPTLTTPIHGEVLMMYLAASTESISVTLFVRREEGQVLRKPKKSGRVAKWAIKLREHDIVFRVKGGFQPERLAQGLESVSIRCIQDTKLEETKPSYEWKIYTDGASSFDGSDARLMLIDPKDKEYTYTLRFEFKTTNNEAESTSQSPSEKVNRGKRGSTSQNQRRGKLDDPHPPYLLSGLLPKDSKESRKIRIKAPQYKLNRGSLYKKSFYIPWLRCIAPPKTDDVIKKYIKVLADSIRNCHKCKEQSAVRKRAEIGAITAGNAWSTLPRNNQKETPFSLTYGSEAIILTVESNVAKDDRGRTKEVTKRKESKKVASIEEAYYQNELCRYHNKRSNHSTHKVGDFVLLLQNNTENPHVWQGPHMIREVHEGELYKIIDVSNHSLIQTAKGTNLRGDIGLETGTKDEVAL
ncbi:hypothetical protein Tco_0088606 [Tanacetum coccineum]